MNVFIYKTFINLKRTIFHQTNYFIVIQKILVLVTRNFQIHFPLTYYSKFDLNKF